MAEPEGLPRLEALVRNWFGWATRAGLPGGCPAAAAMFELDDVEGPVRDKVVAMEAEWRGLLEGLTRQAVELGHLRADLDVEQFVWELCGIYLSPPHQPTLPPPPRRRRPGPHGLPGPGGAVEARRRQASPPEVVHRVRSPSPRRDALGAACPAAPPSDRPSFRRTRDEPQAIRWRRRLDPRRPRDWRHGPHGPQQPELKFPPMHSGRRPEIGMLLYPGLTLLDLLGPQTALSTSCNVHLDLEVARLHRVGHGDRAAAHRRRSPTARRTSTRSSSAAGPASSAS